MLIPYSTDAPIYHLPVATVLTMVVNVLLYIPVLTHEDAYSSQVQVQIDEEEILQELDLEMSDFAADGNETLSEEQQQKLKEILEREVAEATEQQSGEGRTSIWRKLTVEFGKFRPWQWLTANYMHLNLLHLLSNLFVLWGFGLVVEGKVGWWRFLLIYNAIGIAGWGLVQILMLFAPGGIGLGASLAIFGILAIALVWAPANEMQCILLAGFRPMHFEASIMSIAIMSVLLQVAISALHVALSGDLSLFLRITSEVLHLIGAAFGFAIGVVMVKRGWVDCENWDVFSVLAGKNTRTQAEAQEDVQQQLEKIKRHEQRQRASAAQAAADNSFSAGTKGVLSSSEDLLARFRSLVAAGKAPEAWITYCQGEQTSVDWQVPEPEFVKYISLVRQKQMWEEAATAMYVYLRRYFERETKIRLALAQLLIQQLQRPQEALEVLRQVNAELLGDQERTLHAKLVAACRPRPKPGEAGGIGG